MCIYVYKHTVNWLIGQVGRVFANGPGDLGSIPGKELHPPLHLSVVAIEKGAFWSPLTTVANFTYLYIL